MEFLYAAFAAAGAEWFAREFSSAALPARIMAVLFIGTRMRALGNMLHECAHGIFVNSPAHNTTLGHILAIFDLSSFPVYVAQHVSHHASLGHPERDLDFKTRRPLMSERHGKLFTIAKIAAACASLFPLWMILLKPVFWCWRSPLWVNVWRIVLLIFVLGLFILPASRLVLFTYVLVPWLTSYQWMKIFSDCADHLFILDQENVFDRSRNHLLPARWLNWLIFPRHDAFHLLHHLFPSLPVRHYPSVHRNFMTHPWYGARTHCWTWTKNEMNEHRREAYGHSK
jgi:fatty acid desaturase